ncbi:glycosyltransferase family 52 [Alysiella filiformis]|uniref:Beta-galactosamide-alpha-2,3-sialyltransferase n=1 Tax=Alysiella filiformis DSM 16848 TaxID=1120981 RepID=A0A286E3Y5_9NEIS|nr:glycosyltransferase family 52 [Alysiella filiformis]QMT31035.1 alpha-2,3-sialyltransferase [Alysiella filiformis]UBQ55975.1 glycosyltransferase family 52 protein [Alysiella filiformis DSM 16848]SOD65620.1 beta-galactosamide-alpha-2,3-sialyltransferase [Alysiella filiformis DSM 16848]
MKNLFICLTPLQALIAQALIRQNSHYPADLLMICYAESDNAKFRHYYHQTAKLCDFAQFVRVPRNAWAREISLFSLSKNLQKQYHTIFAASIDNPNVQFPLSHLNFVQLETFDDGTANLYPNSILYRNQNYGKKAKIIRQLQGIRYQTEDLRQLSAQHHTLYPNQNNISPKTKTLNLWDNVAEKPVSGSQNGQNVQKIVLGQPLFDNPQQNIDVFKQILKISQAAHYFPHPREDYPIPAQYIDTPLIFEDYLLQQIQNHPQTQYQIHHIASTAALNVVNFPRVQIVAHRPKLPLFHNPNFQYLYDLMEKMNITTQTIECP